MTHQGISGKGIEVGRRISVFSEFSSWDYRKKVDFISKNIEYASAQSVAEYVRDNLWRVLDLIGEDKSLINYLEEKHPLSFCLW